jgi:hypothetical protein
MEARAQRATKEEMARAHTTAVVVATAAEESKGRLMKAAVSARHMRVSPHPYRPKLLALRNKLFFSTCDWNVHIYTHTGWFARRIPYQQLQVEIHEH